MNFKIGDRVAAYDANRFYRATGSIIALYSNCADVQLDPGIWSSAKLPFCIQQLRPLKKKKKLHIGLRVKVYGNFSPAEGGSVTYLDGAKGTIIKEDEGFGLEIDLDTALKERFLDHPERIDGVHPRQCQLLSESSVLSAKEVIQFAYDWYQDNMKKPEDLMSKHPVALRADKWLKENK